MPESLEQPDELSVPRFPVDTRTLSNFYCQLFNSVPPSNPPSFDVVVSAGGGKDPKAPSGSVYMALA